MVPGIYIRKLDRALGKCTKELNQARKNMVDGTDLKEVTDRLILTLTRTLAIVQRMDSEEYEAQL